MSYEVRLSTAAARQFRKLPVKTQASIRKALGKIATSPAGGRGGKRLKVVHGRSDKFFRVRTGDYRVMFDVIDEARTILVLGIVHRRDLERWLHGS